MKVDLALKNDIDELMNIYNFARTHMINEGNVTQWDNEEVFKEELINYINEKLLYKVTKNDEIVGCFAYILGVDSAYNIINGNWINDNKYVTIHKIMSKYQRQGIASFMVDYIINKMKADGLFDIKIDTHKNNISMNEFLKSKGFKYCGIISLNGDFNDVYYLRNAYHLCIEK